MSSNGADGAHHRQIPRRGEEATTPGAATGASGAARGYAVALLAVLAALAIRLGLDPLLGGLLNWGLFHVAVLLATVQGGPGPGIAASVLSVVAGWYAVTPPQLALLPLEPGVAVAMAIVFGVNCAIVVVASQLRSARDRAQALTRIIERAPVFATSFDGTIAWWSDGAAQLYGYTAGEAVGRRSAELLRTVFPCDPDEIRRELLARGEWRGALRQTRSDGAPRWLMSRWVLVRDAAGRPESVLEMQVDTTELVEAREALQRSDGRLRRIVETSQVGIAFSSFEGRVRECNAAFREILGYDAASLSALTWREIAPFATEEERTDAMRALGRDQRVGPLEMRLRRKDGSAVWVLVSAAMLPPDEVVVFAVDVSAARGAEEARRASEARFRLMADSAPVLIWVNGVEHDCRFVNRRYLEFLGLPLHEVLPHGWRRAVHPDDAAGYIAAYVAAAERRDEFRGQVRLRRYDGVYRWLESVGVPTSDAAGRFAGYVGCSYDVTDQRRAEDELREADRRKDEFLAMLAHELRNPLAPIRNAVAILNALCPDEERLVRARRLIDRQVDHLARLVDDLLDVSRITRGAIALRREPTSLAALVAEAVDVAWPLVERAEHALSIDLAPEPIAVDVDRARMLQVLGNLLGNAVKFTPRGGGIRVSTSLADGCAVVRVKDTGIGIPEREQERVFDLFAQEDTSLARSQGGLGIGLTLVRRLVELHGGRVELESAGAGRGSEFTIVLPAGRATPAEEDEPRAAIVPARRAAGLRVLVVEDNADSAESFETVLQLGGHEVRIARDGLDALRVFDELQPHVAFVDLGLPGIDGFEVARRLRSHPARGDVMVVALSGYGRDEDKRRAEAAGFDRHLTKPVDLDVVDALLEGVARSSRADAPRSGVGH